MRRILLAVLAWLARIIARAEAALANAEHVGREFEVRTETTVNDAINRIETYVDSVKIEVMRDGVCIAEGVQVDAGYVGKVAGDVAARLIELGFARRA